MTDLSWPVRILVYLVIIGFVAFFWTDPAGAAGLVGGFFSTVGTAFAKIVTFFQAFK